MCFIGFKHTWLWISVHPDDWLIVCLLYTPRRGFSLILRRVQLKVKYQQFRHGGEGVNGVALPYIVFQKPFDWSYEYCFINKNY